MNTIEENLSKLKEEIAPCKPTIIAVTKYFDESKLIGAYNCGMRDFAENRVQDALAKIERLPDNVRSSSRFHLIGHLQSNKVKKAVGVFDLIQSVDSLKLAEAISSQACSKGVIQRILLQVNNANEECKTGFNVNDLRRDFDKIICLEGVKVEGLMNIAPILAEMELHKLFDDMQNLKKELETKHSYELRELSMGMSGDYKVALEHGATMIRIGRKLFT